MGSALAKLIGERRPSAEVPSVFCWTKMGAEAGQSLENILKRKELERQSGEGVFCWGIGNSLGTAAQKALDSNPGGVEVLFSPMKSAAKKVDKEPDDLLLWTSYKGVAGSYVELPEHAVVTSRSHGPSGARKSSHYALLCFSANSIDQAGPCGEIDATRAVNYLSRNALGASQVTAMVQYRLSGKSAPEKPYRILFRASMHDAGFARLGSPVLVRGEIAKAYARLTGATTKSQWKSISREIRSLAKAELSKTAPHFTQGSLF